MSVENLLQCLDLVKKRSADKWQARCPAHDDKSPSLAIKELEDGRILIHCFAGCGAAEILQSIGMSFSDLYPAPINGDHLHKVRKPFNAGDVLTGIAFEILVAWHFAKQLAADHELSDTERTRLLICASRLQRGMEVTRG
jgi:hypothetical protein